MFIFYIATSTLLFGMICPIDRSNGSCYSAAIEINPLHDVELGLWGLALFESNLKHYYRIKIIMSYGDDQFPPEHVRQWWIKHIWHLKHQGPLLLTWFYFNPSMDK